MAQINQSKTEVFDTPPTGMCAWGFSADGMPVYIDSTGTIHELNVASVSPANIIANRGIGAEADLPTINDNGDVYVTNDTGKVYVAVGVSWYSNLLLYKQIITDNSAPSVSLFQWNGEGLIVLSMGIELIADNVRIINNNGRVFKDIIIPPWDMYTEATKDVTHGLTGTELNTMIIIGGVIMSNTGYPYQLNHAITAGAVMGGWGSDSTMTVYIPLFRTTGGPFDSLTFQGISEDRGRLTISYIPD